MTTNRQTGKLTGAGLLVSLLLSVLLTWGVGKSSVMASTAEKPIPKRILAIFLFKQGLPWAYRIEESMRIALASKSDFPTELNVEHADLSRYPEEKYIPKVIELLRYKYSKRKMDVVIAVGDESTDLLTINNERGKNETALLETNIILHFPNAGDLRIHANISGVCTRLQERAIQFSVGFPATRENRFACCRYD